MDLIEEETVSTIRFSKKENWLSCFGHVINLAVRELLDEGLMADVPRDSSNIYEMDILYSGDIGSDLGQNPLVKLRRGICKIR